MGKRSGQAFLQEGVRMASKHEKMCNIISYQGNNKITIKYHFLSTRSAIMVTTIIKTDNTCQRGCSETGIQYTVV